MIDENGDKLGMGGLWLGVVVSTDDPDGLGRIQARVPGLFEPRGPWLDPLLPGTGTGTGTWSVPPAGARVAISMAGGGRSTDKGWYIPAGWRGVSELPTEIADGDPSVFGIFSDRYAVVLDPRSETGGASIRDRVHGDVIRLDATDLSIEIRASTDVKISAGGSVSIDAPLVLIQGRPVFQSATKPI